MHQLRLVHQGLKRTELKQMLSQQEYNLKEF